MFKFFILLSLSLSLTLGTTMAYGEEAQESYTGEVSEQATIILGSSDGELVVCRSTSRGLVCEDPSSFRIVISTCVGKEGADLISCLSKKRVFAEDEDTDLFHHRLGPVMGLRHNFKSFPTVMDSPTASAETDFSACMEKGDKGIYTCLYESGAFAEDEDADLFHHRLGPLMGLRHNFKSFPAVMDYPTASAETDFSACAEKEDLTALIKCLDELGVSHEIDTLFHHRLGPLMGLRHNFKDAPN